MQNDNRMIVRTLQSNQRNDVKATWEYTKNEHTCKTWKLSIVNARPHIWTKIKALSDTDFAWTWMSSYLMHQPVRQLSPKNNSYSPTQLNSLHCTNKSRQTNRQNPIKSHHKQHTHKLMSVSSNRSLKISFTNNNYTNRYVCIYISHTQTHTYTPVSPLSPTQMCAAK